MKDQSLDTSDEKEVRNSTDKQRRRRDRELNDVRAVLLIKEGRRFLWRYLSACGVFQESYHPSGQQMAFNEGKRNIGLKLLADIMKAKPEAYHLMQKEEGELNA